MPDSDHQLEIEAPEELLADMRLPSDAKTFFLGGIFVFLMLTAALPANRTRYFRVSTHNHPDERACRRRDRPCHVVDRSWRSRSMGDCRIHSELCPDYRARRSHSRFPVRRLTHHHFDLASPAPGGALWRHPCDRRGNGDANASRQTIHAQSGSGGLLFRFWFWLWGIPGAILSAPNLATTKIVCDRIRPLAALGHILAR
jgi:hypothetical protein